MTPEETDQTKIALINNNIQFIQRDLADIKTSVKELAGVYITKLQFDDLQKSMDTRLLSVEKSRRFFAWLIPVVSSILTAVGTFLVLFYLQNAK